MITFHHDLEADAVSVSFSDDPARYAETREVAPGLMIDLDANGDLLSIEVLGVAARSAVAGSKAA